MSDSSGDEGALQIDIERSNESVRGGGGKTVSGKAKKGWEPGDVVWAKVTGFNYWPAKDHRTRQTKCIPQSVTYNDFFVHLQQVLDAENDLLVPHWLKLAPRSTFMLARFFATYDMQWVSSNSAETYAKGLKKKFHNKSKRKVFLKAIQEARSFLEDGSLSEGMTLKPLDPVEEDQVSSTTETQSQKTKKDSATATVDPSLLNHIHTCTIPPTTQSNPPISGSRRRKGSTPRRLSSSSSARSSENRDILPEVKKAKLDDGGIQAFTCAPLPLSTGGQT